MMQVISVILTLVAVSVLVLLVSLLAALMRNGSLSIALPGLGLIISGWLALLMLLVIEVALVLLAAWLKH